MGNFLSKCTLPKVRVVSLLKGAIACILPFQNLSLYRTYLSLARGVTLYPNGPFTPKLALIYGTLTVYLLDLVYLWATKASTLERLRHADLIFLMTELNSVYPCFFSLFLMLFYILWLIFTVKQPFIHLLEGILFQENHPMLTGISLGSRSTLQTSRQIAFWTLNAIRPLIIIADILIVTSVVTIGRLIINEPTSFLGDPSTRPLFFTWRLLRLTCNFIAYVLALLLYATTCIYASAIGFTFLLLLYLRHRRNETLLPSASARPAGPFPWSSVAHYLTYRTDTFRYLFIFNRTFGYIFLAFLLTNLPPCAFIVVRLALGVPSPVAALTLSYFLIQGFIGCVLIHWFIARCTSSLAAPVKRLFLLMVATGHRMGNLRVRLTVNLAIARLNDRYGITYGAFGCVTMGSFAKCMLLFGELVSYSYKLIRNI